MAYERRRTDETPSTRKLLIAKAPSGGSELPDVGVARSVLPTMSRTPRRHPAIKRLQVSVSNLRRIRL